jgi:retron-type reverse transcriptase
MFHQRPTRPTQLHNRPEHPNPRLQEEQYETSVPTISDRIAQTVVARRLEAKVEPIFHPDSYGYRPYRSALDAVAVCRERCWKTDWVIDLDIQKFLDALSHCAFR